MSVQGVRERALYRSPRIGDRDRRKVADFLGLAYAEGFLSLEEFDKRSGKALCAKTEDHLGLLLWDLPSQIETENPKAPIVLDEGSYWPDRYVGVTILAIISLVLLITIIALVI
jgi:hypothetical protein